MKETPRCPRHDTRDVRRVPVIRQPCGHPGRTLPEMVGRPALCAACWLESGEWVRRTSIPAPVVEAAPEPPVGAAAGETAARRAAAARERALHALADHIRATGRNPRTHEWDAAARAAGLPIARTLILRHGDWAAVCNAARAIHGMPPIEAPKQPSTSTLTREERHQRSLETLAGLWQQLHRRPTSPEYGRAAGADDLAANTLTKRHGTWVAACEAARALIPTRPTIVAVDPDTIQPITGGNRRRRGGYRYGASMAGLAECIHRLDRYPTKTEWDELAETHGWMTSSGLRRYHDNRWGDVCDAARALLRETEEAA